MELYEIEGFLRGKCLPGDLLVGESKAQYLFRKLRERDALERELCMSEAKCKGYFSDAAVAILKCDSLAAENACLKQSIEEVAEAFETGTDGALATAVDDAVSLTTPATDGVLKRIQAQGVDRLADHLSGLNIMASETSVREFAAQLRKEASNG